MKALIVRLSAIGDVVHTLPALAALNRSGWETGWLVEPAARPLLEHHPMLAQVAAVPPAKRFGLGEARRALAAVRRVRYDVALDFQGLWKSAAWARLSGAPRVLGYRGDGRREPLSAMLLNERRALPAAAHVIDKNLALLAPLGVDAVGEREFPLPPTTTSAVVVEDGLARLGVGPFAILNPGGGWESKLWPPEGFGAVAVALRDRGLASVVSWGPGEQGLADRVVAASRGAAVRAFATALLDYVELARRARLVVAADTGPLHLACAIGTPVVGLFGPTDPARNGPFSPADVVVRRAPPCAPCHRRVCPRHGGVMASITPAEVVSAVDRRLCAPDRARGAV